MIGNVPVYRIVLRQTWPGSATHIHARPARRLNEEGPAWYAQQQQHA